MACPISQGGHKEEERRKKPQDEFFGELN